MQIGMFGFGMILTCISCVKLIKISGTVTTSLDTPGADNKSEVLNWVNAKIENYEELFHSNVQTLPAKSENKGRICWMVV